MICYFEPRAWHMLCMCSTTSYISIPNYYFKERHLHKCALNIEGIH